MIKKDGKFYVVVEFNSDFMAVGFETALKSQRGVIVDHMGTVLPAAQADDKLEGGGMTVTNTNTGNVNGTLSQIGVVEGVHRDITGRRVR